MRAQIAFLQETHLTGEGAGQFAAAWGKHRYFACYTSGARGVAILVHHSVPFKFKSVTVDPAGRFVKLLGSIESNPVVFLNIYGPNVDTPSFFETLLGDMEGTNPGIWIIGGDFNFTMTADMDRSGSLLGRVAKSALYVQSWMDDCSVIDVWRVRHPNERRYTFYSPPHRVFSRIDMFLIPSSLNAEVVDCGIEPRLISDHGMVWLMIDWNDVCPRDTIWRFKSRALNDGAFRQQLFEAVNEFWEMNNPADTSNTVNWLALKVYVRGRCMGIEGGMLRAIRCELNGASIQLREEDAKWQDGEPGANPLRVRQLQATVEECLDREIHHTRWPARVLQYVEGERPGRTLARIAQREFDRGRQIVCIKDAQGNTHHSTLDIKTVFQEHFEGLYSEGPPLDLVRLQGYLGSLGLPVLLQASREALDAPLAVEEILQAVRDLAPGKAPGLDGLDLSFYKYFSPQIAPRLLEVYAELMQGGQLPADMADTMIVLLLKPGKDPTDCSSYRPLSLINSDVKILAKILANRCDTVLELLLSDDQTGFMAGRSTSDNLRRLQAVAAEVDEDSDCSVVSLDAARAFDTVWWPYLFAVLEMMGFGPVFLRMIKLLYSGARARILVNGSLTGIFNIKRGTRQGCPFSPGLFNLAYEPLLCAIRQSLNGRGINVRRIENTVSAYADDVLVYLTDPAESLPLLVDVLATFGGHSGILINWDKSLVYPMARCDDSVVAGTGLRYEPKVFKYLGIYITRDAEESLRLNLYNVMAGLEERVARWGKLQLSMAGRVALLKMVVLPKFLYVFRNLPVRIPQEFFAKCRRLCTSLIWGSSQARIAYSTLCRPVVRGGLAAPCIETYYMAAQLQYLVPLMQEGDVRGCDRIGAAVCAPCGGPALLDELKGIRKVPPSPVRTSLDVWAALLRRCGQVKPFVAELPLRCSFFSQTCRPVGGWTRWSDAGIEDFADFFEDGLLKTKAVILQQLGGSPADTLLVHRIYAQMKGRWPMLPCVPPTATLYQLLVQTVGWGKLVSHLYRGLVDIIYATPMKARERWETDLNRPLTDKEWEVACEQTRKVSVNARYRLIQYKYLTRYYMTPMRIARFVPEADPKCPRCSAAQANFLHLIWDCPVVVQYWDSVFVELERIMGQIPTRTIELVFLGAVGMSDRVRKRFLSLALLLAKREIVLKWMRPTPPSVLAWIQALVHAHETENKFGEILPMANKPLDIWGEFEAYLSQIGQDQASQSESEG